MKALVYGLARSGQAVVERLVEQGDTAVVVDATLGNELGKVNDRSPNDDRTRSCRRRLVLRRILSHKYAARSTQPLRLYARLELGIGAEFYPGAIGDEQSVPWLGIGPLGSTSLYGYTLGLSALLVLLTSPVLGAMAQDFGVGAAAVGGPLHSLDEVLGVVVDEDVGAGRGVRLGHDRMGAVLVVLLPTLHHRVESMHIAAPLYREVLVRLFNHVKEFLSAFDFSIEFRCYQGQSGY